MGDRWQLSLDLQHDPALRERVERVMAAERRRKRADFVRAAVEAYIEEAEQRLDLVHDLGNLPGTSARPSPAPASPQRPERKSQRG